MKKLFAMMFIFLATIGTASAEWKKITESKLVDTFVDFSTVRTNGKYRELWLLTDYRGTTQDAGDKVYLSTKTKVRFDCQQEKSLDLSILAYSEGMGQGDVVATVTNDETGKWQHIVPGTNGSIAYKVACRK